jgi:hypothetical protein
MIAPTILPVEAELIGRAYYDGLRVDIVRSLKECRPAGPAENALLAVERRAGVDLPVGRYISWIGYHDVDLAVEREPKRWATVEPAVPFQLEIVFVPFRRPSGTLI